MKAVSTVISRRMVLAGMGAVPVAAALPKAAWTQAGPADAIIVSLADLHSSYRQLARIVTAVRGIKAAAGDTPVAILINGDIFERGNVVALRSEAVADWAFLEALRAEAPVVVNLGNHETAILDDMAMFVERAERAGISVIGNLVDVRDGGFFAPVSTRLTLGTLDFAILGLAATNPFVYRQPARDTLAFIDPVTFAAQNRAAVFGEGTIPVVMSHAGVTPDRDILKAIDKPSLFIGGHDHLVLDHAQEGTVYFHGGSWGQQMRVVRVAAEGPRFEVETVAIDPSIEADASLQAIVDAQMDAHLEDAERAVIVERGQPLDLASSILLAVEAVRAAADADVAMLGHTTFGQPLAAGPLTQYDFDAFVRFGGDIRAAEISGETLAGILKLANQHRAASLDERTGDFVYADAPDIDPAATYRLAVNGWTATNQKSYLGTDDLEFTVVDGLELKQIVRDALAGGA